MKQVLQNDIDLLNPLAELETRKHKLKRLVQSPNYFFMVLILDFVEFDFLLVIDDGTLPLLMHESLFTLGLCFLLLLIQDVKCQGCFNG